MKVLECLVEGDAFDEADSFEEELSNPKGVKEIASTIASLALLKPANFFAAISELLGQVMAPN